MCSTGLSEEGAQAVQILCDALCSHGIHRFLPQEGKRIGDVEVDSAGQMGVVELATVARHHGLGDLRALRGVLALSKSADKIRSIREATVELLLHGPGRTAERATFVPGNLTGRRWSEPLERAHRPHDRFTQRYNDARELREVGEIGFAQVAPSKAYALVNKPVVGGLGGPGGVSACESGAVPTNTPLRWMGHTPSHRISLCGSRKRLGVRCQG